MALMRNLITLTLAGLCVQQAVAKSFGEQCAEAHNKYRKLHGVPELKLDNSLQKYAQEWADKLAKTKTFKHRPKPKYGENIFSWNSKSNAAAGAVKTWYQESKKYNFTKPGFSSNTGHFTQVVWKNSKKIGCGIAKANNMVYVVANYYPPGNFLGSFRKNVLKKK